MFIGQVIATIATPIPEPASYTLMLAGLGLVGSILRHRRAVKNNNARAG